MHALNSKPSGRRGYDEKCPDGFVTNGWRRVTKGGYVNFQHSRRYAPELFTVAGMFVFMEISDCWGIDAHIWSEGPFIGTPLGTYSEKEWLELPAEEREPAPLNCVKRLTERGKL